MRSEKDYIDLCKQLIEDKFAFGNGNGWKQRDLEYLTERIEQRSGILLSLSTLKRIWKSDFEQTPHPSTLNALVSLLGYADWQAFKIANAPVQKKPNATIIKSKSFLVFAVLGMLIFAGILLFTLPGFNEGLQSTVKINGEVTFSANKLVATGVPNTVIFNYDLSTVEADSFFIQQSWNEANKVSIDPEGAYYSSIYYLPGFHRAKLIANDSIIEKRNVHILTEGWLPVIRHTINDVVPTYLKSNDFIRDGKLQLQLQDIKASNFEADNDFLLTYFLVRDFGPVSSSNFRMETGVQCDEEYNTACPGIQILIITEAHIFILPLTIKGCVKHLGVKMGEIYQSGENNDLSAFGTDVYQEQHLALDVKDKNAKIYLNNQLIHEVSFKNDLGIIKGFTFRFTNLGSIDYFRLYDENNQMIYNDAFESM